jgi:hypothetical protein
MAKPPTRNRITAFRDSLQKLRPEEMPPWDMGRIYGELLDVVAAEHPEEALAKEAERPVKNSDRRANVQVAAMMTVLDQLLLLYPRRVSAPAVSAPRRSSILDREW